jgi:hypothetical protein
MVLRNDEEWRAALAQLHTWRRAVTERCSVRVNGVVLSWEALAPRIEELAAAIESYQRARRA